MYLLFFYIVNNILFIEKRGTIKKIKKEINSFTYGVQLYEQFLQLNINIVNKEKFNIINIILKSLNNDMSYKVILEEMESSNDLKSKFTIYANYIHN